MNRARILKELLAKEDLTPFEATTIALLEAQKASMDQADHQIKQISPSRRSMYYDLEGKPCGMWEWSSFCEDPASKVVKQENIGPFFISTVFIGIDMRMFAGDHGVPLIYETMVFYKGTEEWDIGSLDDYQDRYATREMAIECHEEAVHLVQEYLKTKGITDAVRVVAKPMGDDNEPRPS